MMPKSGHRFSDKDHALSKSWSGMTIPGKVLPLQAASSAVIAWTLRPGPPFDAKGPCREWSWRQPAPLPFVRRRIWQHAARPAPAADQGADPIIWFAAAPTH